MVIGGCWGCLGWSVCCDVGWGFGVCVCGVCVCVLGVCVCVGGVCVCVCVCVVCVSCVCVCVCSSSSSLSSSLLICFSAVSVLLFSAVFGVLTCFGLFFLSDLFRSDYVLATYS